MYITYNMSDCQEFAKDILDRLSKNIPSDAWVNRIATSCYVPFNKYPRIVNDRFIEFFCNGSYIARNKCINRMPELKDLNCLLNKYLNDESGRDY